MRFEGLAVDTVLSTIGERLRRARLESNLTQQELATDVGVSLKTVRNAEDGQNISLETLVRLLKGLRRVDELDAFLVEDGPSPVALAERKGQQRQRATGKRSSNKSLQADWKW
jgi:transcriptional regulator with XRE-family HTH domain